jgi:hypothetical protein
MMHQTMNVIWTVTENERWSVLNALRIAAEVSTGHAKDMRDLADSLRDGHEHPMFAKGEGGVIAAEGLADVHARQAEEWQRLYSQVEEAPSIVVCESDED